jgi:hypothetical protein
MSAKQSPPPSPSLEWFSVTRLFQSGSAGELPACSGKQEQAGKARSDPEAVVFDEDYLMSMLELEEEEEELYLRFETRERVIEPPEQQRAMPGKDVLMVHMLGDLDDL